MTLVLHVRRAKLRQPAHSSMVGPMQMCGAQGVEEMCEVRDLSAKFGNLYNRIVM